MTASSWKPSLAFAWRPENDGQPYHVDPNDPGKGTSWGVTQETWDEAVRHGLVEGTLIGAGQDALGLILRADYWNRIQGDNLPTGIDHVTFDMAMVSGPHRASMLLQHVLGVTVDGFIGPITVRAAFLAEAGDVIRKLTTADEAFFATLQTFTYFGKGWTRRAEDCRRDALALAGLPVSE